MELTKLRDEEIVREAMANHDKHYQDYILDEGVTGGGK